jgi:hypothetical protein
MKIIYLTNDYVSIMDNKYSFSGAADGTKAYQNSTTGRMQLEAECTADIIQAVEAVWGSVPTVTEPELPTSPAPALTGQDKFNAQVLMQIMTLKAVDGA